MEMVANAKKVIAIAGLAIALGAASAGAQEPDKQPFTDERFAALQEEGAVILLDVFADWCPTCAGQQEILAEYQRQNPDAPLHILTIDFDEQKQEVRRFRAPRQSTLILYRGTEQIWFSIAETRQEKIFAALDEALR